MSKHYLKWAVSEGRERVFALTGEQALIGRSSSADVVIDKPYVSRLHAKLSKSGQGYRLLDMNSTHGVFVNGLKVTEHALQFGDRIRLGKAKFDFHYLDEQALEELEHASEVDTTGLDESLGLLTETLLSKDSKDSELKKLSCILELQVKLGKEFSSEQVFEKILTSALRISGAERGFILLRADGDWEYVLGRHQSGTALQQSEFVRASRTAVRRVASSGEPIFMTEGLDKRLAAQSSVLNMRLRAVACMPLEWISSDSEDPHVRGILYLDSTKPMHALTGLDQMILSKLASETAGVFEKVQMLKTLEEQRKVKMELALAQETQENLLPRHLPLMKGFDVRAFCRPTRQVGGDLYDFFMRPGAMIGVLADVSGKGVSAALLSSLLQGALSMEILKGAEIAVVLNDVNRFICERTQANRFVTLFLFQVDERGGGQFVSAGHNPTYLRRNDTGEIVELPSGHRILGAFESSGYESVPFQMEPGDVMLVYSDGLTDAEDPEGRFFGGNRLKELFAAAGGNGADALQSEILAALDEFTQGRPQTDDVTFVIVEKKA